MQQPQMQAMMKQTMEDMVKDSQSSGEQASQPQAAESETIVHNAHHIAQ